MPSANRTNSSMSLEEKPTTQYVASYVKGMSFLKTDGKQSLVSIMEEAKQESLHSLTPIKTNSSILSLET
eukprot:UN03748